MGFFSGFSLSSAVTSFAGRADNFQMFCSALLDQVYA